MVRRGSSGVVPEDLAKFASHFKGLKGERIANLDKNDFLREFGNLQGSAIYNALQALKKFPTKGIFTKNYHC